MKEKKLKILKHVKMGWLKESRLEKRNTIDKAIMCQIYYKRVATCRLFSYVQKKILKINNKQI